jgi:acetyl esterase
MRGHVRISQSVRSKNQPSSRDVPRPSAPEDGEGDRLAYGSRELSRILMRPGTPALVVRRVPSGWTLMIAVLGLLLGPACSAPTSPASSTGGVQMHAVPTPTVARTSASGRRALTRTGARRIIEHRVVYRVVHGATLAMNVFVPPSPRPRPAVVMVHGGAWKGGSRNELTADPDVVTPIVRAGFVVFVPDYRLAPRYPFPAALHDVSAAVGWVRSNAGRFGVDPSRIGLWGGSAGGNLATMVATTPRGMRRVAAVVSWSGIYDLRLLATHPDRDYRTWVEGYLSCLPAVCPAKAADASPITHLGSGDPPMLLFTSRLEGTGCLFPLGSSCGRPRYHGVPDDQAKEMARALRAKGDTESLVVFPGPGHSTDYAGRAMTRTIAFFESMLGRGASARIPTRALFNGFDDTHLGSHVDQEPTDRSQRATQRTTDSSPAEVPLSGLRETKGGSAWEEGPTSASITEGKEVFS